LISGMVATHEAGRAVTARLLNKKPSRAMAEGYRSAR